MIKKISISTNAREEFCDITSRVEAVVRESGINSGACTVFIPHTTAAVTINENADPSVKSDILNWFQTKVPHAKGYEHTEGNADAHIKSTIIGVDKTILIDGGKLALGTWQGIFFCEFDGPRRRNIFILVSGEKASK